MFITTKMTTIVNEIVISWPLPSMHAQTHIQNTSSSCIIPVHSYVNIIKLGQRHDREFCCISIHSLDNNSIGNDGAKAISEAMKTMTTLKELQ